MWECWLYYYRLILCFKHCSVQCSGSLTVKKQLHLLSQRTRWPPEFSNCLCWTRSVQPELDYHWDNAVVASIRLKSLWVRRRPLYIYKRDNRDLFFYLLRRYEFGSASFQANQNIPSFRPWKSSTLHFLLQLLMLLLSWGNSVGEVTSLNPPALMYAGSLGSSVRWSGIWANCHKRLLQVDLSLFRFNGFLCSSLCGFIHFYSIKHFVRMSGTDDLLREDNLEERKSGNTGELIGYSFGPSDPFSFFNLTFISSEPPFSHVWLLLADVSSSVGQGAAAVNDKHMGLACNCCVIAAYLAQRKESTGRNCWENWGNASLEEIEALHTQFSVFLLFCFTPSDTQTGFPASPSLWLPKLNHLTPLVMATLACTQSHLRLSKQIKRMSHSLSEWSQYSITHTDLLSVFLSPSPSFSLSTYHCCDVPFYLSHKHRWRCHKLNCGRKIEPSITA